MIGDARFAALKQFFGGYLHEDFDAEFGTPDAALSAAIRQHEAASDREELSRGIKAFVQEHADDKDLDPSLKSEIAV